MLQFLFFLYLKIRNYSCHIGWCVFSRNVKLGKHVTIEKGSVIMSDYINDYTYIGSSSYIDKSVKKIGKFCSIAMNAKIGLQNHPFHWVSTHPIAYKKKYGFIKKDRPLSDTNDKKTTIGNDVWIGANVTVLGGVTIENGAVIAANSLVNSNIEPYAIYAGTPAKLVKYRFDQDVIDKLNRSNWWNWERKKIQKQIPLFDDVQTFLDSL